MKTAYVSARTEAIESETSERARRWLLVINHHEARIFRSERTGTKPITVRPNQPEEEITRSHSFNSFARGQEKPEDPTYFGPIADALAGAGQILILGSGTGMANEMDRFIDWVSAHRPEISEKISGAMIVDEHHMTDNEMLALAREHYMPSRVFEGIPL